MLQVRVHGPGDVRVDDVPEPDPGPSDAVVRVAACGICGSDLSYIRLGGLAGPGETPMCLGHEIAGTVDWVGAEVTSVRVGDRVVVQPGERRARPHRQRRSRRRPHPAPAGHRRRPRSAAPRAGRSVARRRRVRRAPRGRHARRGASRRPTGRRRVRVRLRPDRPRRDRHARRPRPRSGRRRRPEPDPPRARARARRAGGLRSRPRTDVWSELARLHGTAPFMFGPTPATAAFIEASGADRVIGDVIDHAARRRPAVGGRAALRPGADQLPHGADEGADHPRLDRVPGPVRRRDRPARPPRPVGVAHPSLPAREIRSALDMLQSSKDCGKVLIEVDAALR